MRLQQLQSFDEVRIRHRINTADIIDSFHSLKLRFPIHDSFFAKALDQVRPGGVPFFVWCISGSRFFCAFLVELGAFMIVASTIVPPFMM